MLLVATVTIGQRVQFPSQCRRGALTPRRRRSPRPLHSPPPPAVGVPAFDPYARRRRHRWPMEPWLASRASRPPLSAMRRDSLQQVDFDTTYIAGNNQGTNLGITDIEASATFAIPIFKNPFLVTPGFAAHFWNGPNTNGYGVNVGPEMPPETYDAYLDTAWKPQITPQLSADLAVRVGMYSDFNFVNYQSVRTPFRRLGAVCVESATDVRGRRRVSGSFVGAAIARRRRDLGSRSRCAVRAVVPAPEAFAPHRDGAQFESVGLRRRGIRRQHVDDPPRTNSAASAATWSTTTICD